jgi:hypothetical protein
MARAKEVTDSTAAGSESSQQSRIVCCVALCCVALLSCGLIRDATEATISLAAGWAL